MYIPEELLTEALSTDYHVHTAMTDQWKPGRLYFMAFSINTTPYIVKFTNQWYSKGPLGRKAYIVSVHTVKSSGVMDKVVKKIAHPTQFVSGVLSAIMQFNAMVQPQGFIMRFKFKQSTRVSSIIERVVGRVPELKSKYDFAFAKPTKTMAMGMMVKKNKKLEGVFSGVFKDPDFDKSTLREMGAAELINTIAPSLEKEPTSKIYRIKLGDIYGAEYPNEHARKFFSEREEPRGKRVVPPDVKKMFDDLPVLKSGTLTEKAEKVKAGESAHYAIIKAATDLSGLNESEIQAIKKFTGSLYESMTLLAISKKPPAHAIDPYTMEVMSSLDDAFSKISHSLPKETTVFRGIKIRRHMFQDVEEYVDINMRYINTPYIKLSSYTSFSFSPKIAFSFGDIHYTIQDEIKKGNLSPLISVDPAWLDTISQVSYYLVVRGLDRASVIVPGDTSSYPDELEVTAARGQILKVVDKSYLVNDNVCVILMEAEFVDPDKIIVEGEYMTFDKMISEEDEEDQKTIVDEFAEFAEEHADDETEEKPKFNGLI